ncbi:hypothetical protein AAFC00_005896 [Neodothiora populina]|uniref:DUF1765-domain-containing protein n=1 Tax=Neodothiora populina TaxID=2781224 RepID=A0ABR3P688_9PEZI
MSTMTAVYNSHDLRSGWDPAREVARGHEKNIVQQQQRNADFPRSASYTFMPSIPANQDYARKPSVPITIKGSFSEEDLIASADDSADASPSQSSGWTTPSDNARTHTDSAHDLVAELHKSPKISVSRLDSSNAHEERSDASAREATAGLKSIVDSTDAPQHAPTQSAVVEPSTVPPTVPAAPAASNSDRLQPSFAKRLSRRLSYSPSAPSSREPSPSKSSKTNSFIKVDSHADGPTKVEAAHDGAPIPPPVGSAARRRTVLKKRESYHESSENKPSGGNLFRRSTLLRRKSTKAPPPSEPMPSESPVRASLEAVKSVPAVPSLPKSFSTDRLPSVHHDHSTPVPRIVQGEKMASLGALSLPRKRDELWSVFRSLDGDFAKFQSKSSALKANVVRGSVLPFLRNYAEHPSSFALRPEDLDRRANILNKWWTALLEMLHGKNNQSISGTDRPAILDALSGIMDRPEWRLSPSPLCPLTRRSMGVATSRNKSSASLASSGVDFLTESVHHNVRNMFVQNLQSQMGFVVDRMSLRNASASLVTFCGKATAYAFFFCPGIAEVLVRLWDTPVDTMRRVLNENNVGKFENLNELSANIVSAFPPAIQQLGFVSLGKMLKHLRTQITLPLGTANIQWYGYWLERWLGRESDLFYAFVKNFHILVTDYLPPDTTKKEHMCVPGMLLVHAQILANLDSTVHRDAGHSSGDGLAGLPANFDDILADPDAVASTLPLPPTNAIRVMAENRLIMLIRDFLSDRATEHPRARHLFAVSFNDLMQACARRSSIYDHSACYTLCDFLEESFLILVRYEHMAPSHAGLINSKFWLDVCKKMISSQNTMTEVRLYAFLYTCWQTITGDPERKADLCLGLLLDEAIFERTFNHWCPMVRAYYMRLLCWRVGRYDGDSEASPRTRLILKTLFIRLRSVWSHYLWLREEAEQGRGPRHSTVPCNPAPGRRLLIVRTDTQVPPSGSFLAFDGLVLPHASPSLIGPNVAFKRHTTLSPVVELDSRPNSAASSDIDNEGERERGLRGFLRSVMGGSKSRSKSRGPARAANRLSVASAPTMTTTPPLPTGAAQVKADGHHGGPAQTVSTSAATITGPRFHNLSFKFSLEFYNKHHGPGAMRLLPPRLPAAAHAYMRLNIEDANDNSFVHGAVQPLGESKIHSKYAGRALAEWTVLIMECQSFFDRRKNEGVPDDKYVETPTLGVEVFSKRAS